MIPSPWSNPDTGTAAPRGHARPRPSRGWLPGLLRRHTGRHARRAVTR